MNVVSDTVIAATFPIPSACRRPTAGQPRRVRQDAARSRRRHRRGGTSRAHGVQPPHIEYRLTLALNANYIDVPERRILFVEPSKGTNRSDYFLGVQELFVDKHIRNVSDRYDFDSVRAGIQPFQFDFRGFLFNDQQLGVRLFGNRDNNRFQYNVVAALRLNKDTNSGLNDVTRLPRKDLVLHANFIPAGFPFVGLTSMASRPLMQPRERRDRGRR